MCMEDIRVMRETQATVRPVTVGASSLSVAPRNTKRVAIIFTYIGASTITLSLSRPAVAAAGIVLDSTNPVLMMDIQHYGALVFENWFAIAGAASQVLSVAESYLNKD